MGELLVFALDESSWISWVDVPSMRTEVSGPVGGKTCITCVFGILGSLLAAGAKVAVMMALGWSMVKVCPTIRIRLSGCPEAPAWNVWSSSVIPRAADFGRVASSPMLALPSSAV